jgi:hypothetical protein
MNDLKHLLDVAATAPRATADPADDLRRARTRARARTGRRLRVGSATLALGAVVALGLGQVTAPTEPGGPAGPAGPEASAESATSADVRLVAGELDADPYTFDLVPQGWSVQGQNAYGVTIAPDDGSTSASPDNFVGKLVILFDQNPPDGTPVTDDGRGFWVREGSDYVTVATLTRGDEPPGVVRVQYPVDAGWTRTTMVEFLGSVHVGPGALPGQG